MRSIKYLLVGGAGFIGSHTARELLKSEPRCRVMIYDNFSSGRKSHLGDVISSKNLSVVRGDVKNFKKLARAMKGTNVVYHFASNPDIARAQKEPDIDFWEGTFLTHHVLEAMRRNQVAKVLYASGSGVYGDTGTLRTREDYSPMRPISTYGASKLAGESLICAYSSMFGITGSVFRFANVVGPQQTHGVGYDFVQRLLRNPKELLILGDGRQDKPYIYVSDVVNAMRMAQKKMKKGFHIFNVAPQDSMTVNEIAKKTVEILGFSGVKFCYTGGDRGWKGDVPVVRMDSQRIRKLGWKNHYSSKQAVAMSLRSLYREALL